MTPTDTTPDDSQAIDPTFARLLDLEEAHDRRVRIVALAAWTAFLASLVIASMLMFLLRNGDESLLEPARAFAPILFGVGPVSLLIAAATSLRWLVRPRAASLRAIDRRLAALEALLTAPSPAVRRS
ncbi:MAG: hypothetical protein AAGN46_09360 [Acidobacteriota bacterium]